jgi:hypothetical protein
MSDNMSAAVAVLVAAVTFAAFYCVGQLAGLELYLRFPEAVWMEEARHQGGGEDVGTISLYGLYELAISTMVAWRTYRSCEVLALDGRLSPESRSRFYVWLAAVTVFTAGYAAIWKIPAPNWLNHILSILFVYLLFIAGRATYRRLLLAIRSASPNTSLERTREG